MRDEFSERVEAVEFQRDQLKPEAISILERWEQNPTLAPHARRLIGFWQWLDDLEVRALEEATGRHGKERP